MLCTRTLILAACALAQGAMPASGATILFSNLVQPGDQYGPDGVGIGHTPAYLNPGDYLTYAVPFRPSMTARLESFQAPLGVISGPTKVKAWLLNDNSGEPGNVLESYLVSNLPAPPGPLRTIASATKPVLAGGQRYWFAITGGEDTFALWTLTLFQGDPVDGGADQSVISGAAQPWNVGPGTRTGALQVLGEVPEPSYITLVGGVIALLGFTRKQFRS